MNKQQSSDVIIIGGGVIGCSIAYHLRKAGVEVLVVEKQEVAAEASSAAAGLLAPLAHWQVRDRLPIWYWQAGRLRPN